jgi:hypothetical protein
MKYTCTEYRQEMILLGLSRRLNDPSLTEAERARIREEIERLEESFLDGGNAGSSFEPSHTGRNR